MRYNNYQNKYRKVDIIRVIERGKPGAAGNISMPSQNEKRARAIGSKKKMALQSVGHIQRSCIILLQREMIGHAVGGAYLGLVRFTTLWPGVIGD